MNLWYVGYGSNLLAQGVANYLSGGERTAALTATTEDAPAAHWVGFEYPLYFAGRSKTWGGGVAFVDIFKKAGHTTHGRARELTLEQFNTLVSRENGRDVALEWADLHYLRPGQTKVLQLESDPEGYRGKYNAVLRLEDIEGKGAYTLTTSRGMRPNLPAPLYRERILAGLLQRMAEADAEGYLQAAERHAPEL